MDFNNQAFLFSSPAFSGTQTPGSVHSLSLFSFFWPDRPTITRDGVIGNKTFYCDGLINDVKDRLENVWTMRVLDDKFSVFSFDFQAADTDIIPGQLQSVLQAAGILDLLNVTLPIALRIFFAFSV